MYPSGVLAGNLIGAACWLAAFIAFGIVPVFNDPRHGDFKAGLFAIMAALFLIWSILNYISQAFGLSKKDFVILKLSNWVLIPAAVIFLTVYNGVFQMRVKGIDLNLSIVPVIIQMYLILVFCELTAYLCISINNTLKFASLKKIVLYLLIRILIIMNVYFCGYFVISWFSWYRFIRTGFTD